MPFSGLTAIRKRAGHLVLCACLLAAMPGAPLFAQDTDTEATPQAVVEAASAEGIRARIELLEARTDIPTAERDLAIEQLRAAAAHLDSARAARQAADDYTEALRAAPETIAALAAESSRPSQPSAVAGDGQDDTIDLQLQLASLQASAVSLRSRQRELDESLRAMAARPADARAELAELRGELDEVDAAIPANASAALVEASQLRVDTARQDLSARIEKTEQELLSLPTREAIATAQRELAARRLQQAETAIATLESRIDAQRKAAAQREALEAQQALQRLAGQPPTVRAYAARTAEIRGQLVETTRALDDTRREQALIRNRVRAVADARDSAEQILAIGRIDNEQGRLLRGLEADLPAVAGLQRSIANRNDALADARVARFRGDQQRNGLQDARRAAQRALSDAGLQASPASVQTMTDLVERRRSALSDETALLAQRIEALSEANALEADLMQRTAQLRTLLDERLLWLPNAAALDAVWLEQLGEGVGWLVSPTHWAAVPGDFAAGLRARPLVPLLLFAIAGVLFAGRRRLTAWLAASARPVGSRDDSFRTTLVALLASILLALLVPLALGGLGMGLRSSETAAVFSTALGSGLLAAAVALFMIGIYRTMCRPDGLFVAHFHWQPQGTKRLGRALWLLALAIAPAALLSGMSGVVEAPAIVDGLGRLGFVIGSLALALFLFRVFKPRGGALTGNLDPVGLAWRTRHVWFWALVATPLALAVLAMAGYHATASELQGRLFTSGWILLATVIAFDVVMRGVLVAGRRAAWQQADARRAKAVAEAEARAAADASGEAVPVLQHEDEIDVVSVSQQTRALLRATAGLLLAFLLWGIWSGIVPALGVFNDVVLWTQVVATAAGDSVSAVTLGRLLMSVLILVLTVVAARNLPGFMEIAFLQRFPLDAGTRYAIVTIARYSIVAIGLLIAFGRIGADWSKLQWIVAALGVGLGFGLQEIVANFVSGIIILFERPVRVGDLVTIGNTTGTVTRIKIRAITITDFDNFEVLVPNKAFITDTVQNWTLTSPVTRLMLKVGIAYGSDVAKAQQLMLDAVSANPQVLSSPSPSVLFLGFGDSALEFEIRAFVGRIEHRLQTQHELHMALDAALRQAGIEIPFPQRDLHLRHSDASPFGGDGRGEAGAS